MDLTNTWYWSVATKQDVCQSLCYLPFPSHRHLLQQFKPTIDQLAKYIACNVKRHQLCGTTVILGCLFSMTCQNFILQVIFFV